MGSQVTREMSPITRLDAVEISVAFYGGRGGLGELRNGMTGTRSGREAVAGDDNSSGQIL